MAIVILGGLLTSALLNLVVLPALYLRYGFIRQPDTTGEELVEAPSEIEHAQPTPSLAEVR